MCLPGLLGGGTQPPPPPAPPPPPPAPPPPPTQSDVSQSKATSSQRQRSLLASGTKQGTILTSPSGLTDDNETKSKKALLGQ